MQNDANKTKIVCAMSGGVDSSVAAALLKCAGFEVVGVFMRLFPCESPALTRARKTAKQLNIPFKVLDLRKEFKKLVIDRFIADSKKGLTPNPCVICNQEIKFGLLVKKALAMGTDHVATGHYARIKKTKDGIYHLLKGKDKNKDQSYFLWRLGQGKLSRIIFPVGVFKKSEVRQMAKKWNLAAANSSESQEVCFARGGMDYFLKEKCGIKTGDIIDKSGKTTGHHQGLWFYTIGQRRGIGLSGGPFYAVAKNCAKNQLIITSRKRDLVSDLVNLKDVLWVSSHKPELPLKIKARIRYRAKEANAILRKNRGGFELKFDKPQFAVTPGQSAVFYGGNELIGGGKIK